MISRILLSALRAYKYWISPMLPSACRFAPTCSVYMMQSIERFGPVSGVWLGLKRLGRCHPFCEGGHDPVPNHPQERNRNAAGVV